MRRPAIAIAVGLVALVLAVAAALAAPSPATLGRMQAEGAVALSSDREGAALLQAQHLRPGDSASGLVALTNTGDQPGALGFETTDTQDTPGPAGGRLSQVLRLSVADVSGATAPFQARLADVGQVALGTLPAGATRVYRVTASFPDTGTPAGPLAGDNAQEGSAVSVGFRWRLDAAEAPAATVAPPASPPVVTPPAPAPAPVGPGVFLRIPAQRAIAPRGLTVFARCEVECRVRFHGQLDTAPLGGRRKTLMAGKVLRRESTEHRVSTTAEQRFYLPFSPRALRRIKLQLRRHGRVGITVVAQMRSAAGSRDARRRIVARTYSHKRG